MLQLSYCNFVFIIVQATINFLHSNNEVESKKLKIFWLKIGCAINQSSSTHNIHNFNTASQNGLIICGVNLLIAYITTCFNPSIFCRTNTTLDSWGDNKKCVISGAILLVPSCLSICWEILHSKGSWWSVFYVVNRNIFCRSWTISSTVSLLQRYFVKVSSKFSFKNATQLYA